MNRTATLALLAVAVGAAPLSAQLGRTDRSGARVPRTPPTGDRTAGDVLGDIIFGRGDARGDSRATREGSGKVPRGHLPPAGMCRVWIDGVPPGHQPQVTDCATAERQRLQHPNARVIYGDQESFPGRGKGKAKRADRRDDVLGEIRRRGNPGGQGSRGKVKP